MRIFGSNGKINFVDINNVFVGFDYEQSCCENFGYTLTEEFTNNADAEETNLDLEDYCFDIDYFKEESSLEHYDEGHQVYFRLVNKEGKELFLMLFNHHNGYYSHGFEFKNGEEVLKESYI